MIKIRNDFHFWVDVQGYEGIYRISIIGIAKGNKFLKQTLLQIGYRVVGLRKDGKDKKAFVHRLLGQHFIYNPIPEKNCINHKDGDKLNNNLSNLEWNTKAENNRHAYKIGLNNGDHKRKCRRGIHPSAKRVIQMDSSLAVVKTYECKLDAEDDTGVTVGYFIKNQRKCPKGYFWKYA